MESRLANIWAWQEGDDVPGRLLMDGLALARPDRNETGSSFLPKVVMTTSRVWLRRLF
jgi:hypothetical protein